MPLHAPWALEHTPDVTDPQWLIIRMVGFILLGLIVWKFAVPAVASMLAERQQDVADTAEQVHQTMQDAEMLRDDYRARLESIEDATEARMAEAVIEAADLREHILAEAATLAEAVRQRARDEVLHEQARTTVKLRQEFANNVVAAAAHAARQSLTTEDNSRLVADFVADLGAKA
jgi:F0F1-type ATP synthase membrane subunit b/b'